MQREVSKIGLGGSCHWCTEGIFISLLGVVHVEQGWISANPPADEFSEAILVHYDPQVISALDLIEVHLETHASSSNHPLRSRYRSAVYAYSQEDIARFSTILMDYAANIEAPLITKVLLFQSFKSSPPKYQDYYRKNPDKPFCQTYISPKLRQLRQSRPELLK